MIFYYLILILIGLVDIIAIPLTSLPNVSLPISVSAGIATAGTMLGVIYQILPYTITALGIIIGSMLVFELAIWTYKLVKWIYQKIPGIN